MPKKTSTRKKRGAGNAQDKHMSEKREMDLKKYQKNMAAIERMKSEGKYLPVEYEGPQSYFAIDGVEIDPETRKEMVRTRNTVYTDVSKMNRQLFEDPMTMEEMEADGLTIGGKKRKTKRRKSNKNKRKKTKRRSRRKNTRRKKGGEKTKKVFKAEALKEYDLESAEEETIDDYVKKCGTKNPLTGRWSWSNSEKCKKMEEQYWQDKAANKSREDMYYDALEARNAKSPGELSVSEEYKDMYDDAQDARKAESEEELEDDDDDDDE